MAGYSRLEPNKVHLIHGGIPVIYNRNNKAIHRYTAERGFRAAINTMQTWATRYFRLIQATADRELCEYDLERFGWELDGIETWLAAMRKVLEEAGGERRKQETIDKLLALAESTTFPEEAATARRMAAARKGKT